MTKSNRKKTLETKTGRVPVANSVEQIGKKTVSSKATGQELYLRIRNILESARSAVARSVNSTQVVANWLVWTDPRKLDKKIRVN